MYGLPQSGMIANELLQKRLKTKGYYQVKHTPGLWKHTWRPIMFVLVVDNFGIKYIVKEHAEHLINTNKENYECIEDWEVSLYCGIKLEWEYQKQQVDLSIPGYIKEMLHKYQHKRGNKQQLAPHKWNRPLYGKGQQMTEEPDITEMLAPDDIKKIQGIVGTLLLPARVIDSTILISLGAIAQAQMTATRNTMKAVKQLLDYFATYPEPK